MKNELDYLPRRVISIERPTVRDMEMCLDVSLRLLRNPKFGDGMTLDNAAKRIRAKYSSGEVVFGNDEVPRKSGLYWVLDYIADGNSEMSVVAAFSRDEARSVVIQNSIEGAEPVTYTFSTKSSIGNYVDGRPFTGKLSVPSGLEVRPALKRVFESISV